ncbi:MAG TPA: cation:proton antiporter [Burkholderiales bacterium]|nr:cation:proton antiporter [Burkholderiales bacterium]
MDLAFLPTLPPAVSQLMLFGVLLLCGLAAGEALRRYASLPRITGYVLAGVLLGPQATGLLDSDALFEARLIVDLAIGLVVFELGSRLDFGWLKRNQWLFAAALAEALFCFVGIHVALVYFGFAPLFAATAAAIGTASSPAVVLLVQQELRSEGQLTERMILCSAVNTVFAYVVLALLLPFLYIEEKVDLGTAVLHPMYVFLGAAALGFLASRFLLLAARWFGKNEDRQFVLLVALVVATIGLAHSLKLSVVVALVTFGMLSRNFDSAHVLLPVRFGHGGQIFFVILFLLSGASLEFHAFEVAAAAVVAAYVLVRFLGKAAGLVIFSRLSGITARQAGLLAVSLVPMSGLAVVMVRDTVTLYPTFGRELAAVVLSSVVVLELVGPIATQFALRRAGEASPEA